jgi:hypothetical protein
MAFAYRANLTLAPDSVSPARAPSAIGELETRRAVIALPRLEQIASL